MKPRQGSLDKWGLVIVVAIAGFLFFTATVLYTFNVTPLYTAQASLMLYEDDNKPLQPSEEAERKLTPTTVVDVVKSQMLADAVSQRLKDEDRQVFLAPYAQSGVPVSIEEVLMANRDAKVKPGSAIIFIEYQHPHPEMAARVANYYADELVNYFVKINIEMSMRAVEDLRIRADHQREKMMDARAQLAVATDEDRASLEDTLEINKQMYQVMMNKLQSEMAAVALVGSPLRIIDKASMPIHPSSPNIARNLALGAGVPLLVLMVLVTVMLSSSRW